MKCGDFLDGWMEARGVSKLKPAFLLHLAGCKRCRRELAFLKGLSRAMEKEEEGDEAFFLDMRKKVLEAAREENLVVPETSPAMSSPFPMRFLFPLAGVVAALILVVLVLGRLPSGKARFPGEYPLYREGGGLAFVSRLDDGALAKLDIALENAFGGDTSLLLDMDTAPWAEVMDEVSDHPHLLETLFPSKGEGEDPMSKGGGVA